MSLFRRDADPLQDDEVFELMQPIVEAKTWPEMRMLIERHPVLVTDRGPRFFAFVADRSEQKPNEHLFARQFRQAERLLMRCREIGVAPAIDAAQRQRAGPGPLPDEALVREVAELLFQPTWEDTRRMLDQHPDLYGIGALETLQDMLAMQLDDGNEQAAQQMALHLTILSRCRAVGVDAAFEELRRATR